MTDEIKIYDGTEEDHLGYIEAWTSTARPGYIFIGAEDSNAEYAAKSLTVAQVREYANKLLHLAAEVAAEQDIDNDSR